MLITYFGILPRKLSAMWRFIFLVGILHVLESVFKDGMSLYTAYYIHNIYTYDSNKTYLSVGCATSKITGATVWMGEASQLVYIHT